MTSTEISNNQRVYDPRVNVDKLPSLCLLCGEGELDELGHIIPKFVMRWLRSASKKKEFYLNNTAIKVSDTLALKMLCNRCEDILSCHEKLFTDKYFKQYYRKRPAAKIGSDIYLFSLSIAWRILVSTPMMKGEEDSDEYFGELRDLIKSHLLLPNKNADIDVYIFHADEIAANLPEQSYRTDLLKFSVRQGIFVQHLTYDIGFRATVAPIPLVHFKLGVYYFIVTYQGYLQNLMFPKIIESSEGSQIHILRYTEELIGFLNHISNGDFLEVVESAISMNVKYDRFALT